MFVLSLMCGIYIASEKSTSSRVRTIVLSLNKYVILGKSLGEERCVGSIEPGGSHTLKVW